MSNILKLCPAHFTRRWKNCLGGFTPTCNSLVTGLGQSRDREAADTLSANPQFAPLPAEAGCGTC